MCVGFCKDQVSNKALANSEQIHENKTCFQYQVSRMKIDFRCCTMTTVVYRTTIFNYETTKNSSCNFYMTIIVCCTLIVSTFVEFILSYSGKNKKKCSFVIKCDWRWESWNFQRKYYGQIDKTCRVSLFT